MHSFEHANAHFVTDFLAVGGDLAYRPTTAIRQAAELADQGITHVLDVRQEWDDAELWSHFPEVSYRWSGIDDAGQRVPGEWFDEIVGWSVKAIADGGVLLTHCHMGVNRGPSAGYAVLLGLGWDPIEALSAIRAARPIAAMAYAEDALAWHFDRTDASPQEWLDVLDRVGDWRLANPIDVQRIIRMARV